MAVNFEEAVRVVLSNEEGLTDHPSDVAGLTNFGITYSDLITAINEEIVPHSVTIANLTKAQAIEIYRELYWNKLNLSRIETQSIANKILDTSVNVGMHFGIVILQRAIRSATGEMLNEDGFLGEKTLKAVNEAPPAALLAAYRSEQAARYREIVLRNPEQRVFEKG